MANLTNFETNNRPASTESESETTDGGFNRRIGLGLVLSVGANVLLLQGAGMMKSHMSVSPQTGSGGGGGVIHLTRPTPIPSPIPSPSAEVKQPTPTPRPQPKPDPTPIPKPVPDIVKPKPSPTPIAVKPTPQPIAKPAPTVKPDVMPEKTATPTMSSPANMVTQPAAPAADTTPTAHEATPRSSKQPALAMPTAGAAKIIGATLPRESTPATDTKFVVDANQVAPTRQIADLPRPSLASQISAAISNATSANVQTSNSNALDAEMPSNNRAPGQLRNISSKMPGLPAATAVLHSRTSDPTSNFSMPTGGQISAGSPSAHAVATHGGTPATFSNSSAAGTTGIKNGEAPTAFVSPGNGEGRGIQPLPGRRRGAPHGGDPTGPGGSSLAGKPGDAPGVPGFNGRADDGTGKGPGYTTNTRPGGPVNGFGNETTAVVKPGTGEPAISEGNTSKTPTGPKLHGGGDSTGTKDPGAGSAVNAVFNDPSADSISVPESLRSIPYDATVTVRVVLEASGRISVEVTNPSKFPALDAQVKAVCGKIHFKPAMQDGKAVDEAHTFNFHLHNGS